MDRDRIGPPEGGTASMEQKELSRQIDDFVKEIGSLRKQLDAKEEETDRLTKENRELQSQCVREKTMKLKSFERESTLQTTINSYTQEISRLQEELQLSPAHAGNSSSASNTTAESHFTKRIASLLKQNNVELERLKKLLQETRRKNTLLTMQLKQHAANFSRVPQSLHIGDSTSVYPYPHGTQGPQTNMTLSLQSVPSSNRLQDYTEGRGNANGASYRQDTMEMDKSSPMLTLGTNTGISFDRNGPVEGSDHFYANSDYRRHAQTEGAHQTNTVTRSRPVPKPRSRTTTKPAMAPVKQDNGDSLFQDFSDGYEIVERPPAQYNPDVTSRQVNLTAIREGLTPGQDGSGAYMQMQATATRLHENITQFEPMLAVGKPVSATTNNHRVCGVCNKQFGDEVSQDDFAIHCIECADRAASNLEGSTMTYPVVDSNLKACPICDKVYDNDKQIEFENHVQSHFQDEDTRNAGWENVSPTAAS